MRSLRTRTTTMATVAALSLALAACGGSDAAEDSGSTTDEAPTEDMTEDMTEEAGTESMSDDMGSETMSEGTSALTMQPQGPACDQIAADGEGSSEGMADDPVATAASNNPLLSTLVTAVQEAGLVDTLNNAEALTVFAPINAAFEKIPQEDLEALLADQDALTDVLTLHVAEGQNDAAALAEAGTVTSLQGGELTFDADAMTVSSGSTEANVVCANVQTANATVHLIDTVLMP